MNKIFQKTHDPIWHLQLGVLSIIGLQLFTGHFFLPADKYLIIGVEVWLLILLSIMTPVGYTRISRPRRLMAIVLIGYVTLINFVSLGVLVTALLTNHFPVSGLDLILNAAIIYFTNIIIFALWYWEMDGGGPDRRLEGVRKPDFVFPQQLHTKFASDHWRPGFTDYVYLSATNVTNFASADTIPVSHRAKILMMVQSLASVATVVLVAARAISIMQ
jgi:hypothetical protein